MPLVTPCCRTAAVCRGLLRLRRPAPGAKRRQQLLHPDRPAQPAPYRFERLPSQQMHATAFAAIETQAEAALARVGLRRDDTSRA